MNLPTPPKDAQRATVVLLHGLLAGLALLSTLSLVSLWIARNGYPYDLEWMEGGMLVHSWRLLMGRPTHGPPSVEWIPYLYPTGYASVVALFGQVFGLSMGLGRAISIVGTVMAALAMPYITRRAGRGLWPGAIAGAAFLACYPFSGAFYDLVRLDGLMVGLWAWSIALALDGRRGTIRTAGLLLCCAYLVKHNVALTGFPIVVGLWHRGGRAEALRFALWAALPALAITLYLELTSGGTYLDWLLRVPASHGWVGKRVFPGVGSDIGQALPFAALAAIMGLAARLERWRWGLLVGVLAAGLTAAALEYRGGMPSPAVLKLWAGLAMLFPGLLFAAGLVTKRLVSPSWRVTLGVGVAGTAIVMSMLMRGHVGGFVNVNIPAHWVICMAAGIALGSPSQAVRSGRGLGLAALAAALMAAQLVWADRALDVERLSPKAEDVEVGELLVAKLRGLPEPVLSPYNPWLLVLAGHSEPGWQLIGLWDVNHSRGPWPESGAMVRRAMKAQHWTYILDGARSMEYGIDDGYDDGQILVPASRFRPASGYQAYPRRLRKRQTPTR